MSSLVGKVKEAIRGDKTQSTQPVGTFGTTTGNTAGYDGAHADPTNADPNVANKLDPRADSYSTQRSTQYGAQPSVTSNTGYSDIYGGSTNTSPYSSDVADKLDPRVDSTAAGYGGHYPGTTDENSRSTNASPLDSNVASKLGPRVDSDLDGRGKHSTQATPGSGIAQKTTSQHGSNSDGSKAYGGDATYSPKLQKGLVGGGKIVDGRDLSKVDTHDAAQVPPSVFAAHHGEPIIAHDDHQHNRAGRHGGGPDDYGSGIV
ncbi:MAG: hypothetical protein M1839_007121 [Geoglossum umbratile]|nr:MAG: hypothetical protein M1839_007121 [Geoglossum umbratile]